MDAVKIGQCKKFTELYKAGQMVKHEHKTPLIV